MHSLQLLSLAIISLLNIHAAKSLLFLVDPYLTKMVELRDNNQPCKIHYDRKFMENTMSKYEPKFVQNTSPTTLNTIAKSCTDSDRKKTGFIFPGTKWCGPGNIATRYTDLGIHEKEDRCCRDHDHCPNQLEPGQCRNGICNISPFTSSHCDCDQAFRNCLVNGKSDVANVIGSIYFNIGQRTCFRERRFCPQGMRENLSYSWFCAEWKFTPLEYFAPSRIEDEYEDKRLNEVADEPFVTSKMNVALQQIFGDDEEIAKIMDKSNT